MLQIYCYGPTEAGFLDIPPAAKLDLEALAEPFDEDLTLGEYALPITIPFTPRNLRITGFANRLVNFAKAPITLKVDIYDNGFPEIQGGKLTILEKKGSFQQPTGQFVATIAGAKGLYGTIIKGRKLSSLSLGGTITFTETSSRAFAQALMTGAYPLITNIAFAPLAIQDFFDTERPDYDNEFLAKETVNNIILTGPDPEDWVFGRPQSADPDLPANPGNSEFIDYRTIPFLRLTYVLKKCFEEFGYTPSGPFFSQPWFNNLFLFNNRSIERYNTASSSDTNRTVNPADHVPDILISEFIKAVCATFGMYPRFTTAGNVEFRFRRDQFRNITIFDLTPHVSADFASTRENPGTEPEPYALAYEQIPFLGDRTPDLKGRKIVASVATRDALATLDIGRGYNINDIALVESENLFYRVADATATPVLWEAYADNLYPVTVSPDGNIIPIQQAADATTGDDYTLPIPVPATYVTLNTVTAAYESRGYLGIKTPGSYINNNLRTITNPCPLAMFYIGPMSTDPGAPPTTFYHNRYPNNTRISRYTLALTGPDGMYQNFHAAWLNTRQQPEVIKIMVKANTDTLQKIRAASQIQLFNTRYLLYRIERAVPMPDTIIIELALI